MVYLCKVCDVHMFYVEEMIEAVSFIYIKKVARY